MEPVIFSITSFIYIYIYMKFNRSYKFTLHFRTTNVMNINIDRMCSHISRKLILIFQFNDSNKLEFLYKKLFNIIISLSI